MLLNRKQCNKNVNNWFMLYCLCIVSIDLQDGAKDLRVNANESMSFSFVRRMTHENAQKCYRMLIKMRKSLLNLIYAQMIVFCRL